jgi:hypothetical protein
MSIEDKNILDKRKEEIIINDNKSINPGEKGFSLALIIFGLFFAFQSFLMYQDKPGASSHAAVPLFVSIIIILFSTLNFIFDFKKESANKGLDTLLIIRNTLTYMFNKDILVIIGMVLIYCIGLLMDVGFYILTPIFLWGSMSYLMRKKYLYNVIWTGLSIFFIYIMFSFAFNVVLP